MSTATSKTGNDRTLPDPDMDRVLAIMATGIDQRTASLMVWAPAHPNVVPTFGDPPATWSAWIAIEVRRIGNLARRALGLAELPVVGSRIKTTGRAR